tara:strand:- start:4144 stop:4347 length:204 start_codon:yes stop_codon:yes gene_type:complete
MNSESEKDLINSLKIEPKIEPKIGGRDLINHLTGLRVETMEGLVVRNLIDKNLTHKVKKAEDGDKND